MKVIGVVPLQLPFVVLSVCPWRGEPETLGGLVLVGMVASVWYVAVYVVGLGGVVMLWLAPPSSDQETN